MIVPHLTPLQVCTAPGGNCQAVDETTPCLYEFAPIPWAGFCPQGAIAPVSCTGPPVSKARLVQLLGPGGIGPVTISKPTLTTRYRCVVGGRHSAAAD